MSNVYSLLAEVSGLMSKYIVCRDAFLVGKESIDNEVISTNKRARDNKLSIISLNNQIEKLILERDNITKMEMKYKRILDILEVIDKKTKNGEEKFILRRVNLMFNEIAEYG